MSFNIIRHVPARNRRSTVAGVLIIENTQTHEMFAAIAVCKEGKSTLTLVVDFIDYPLLEGVSLYNKNGYVAANETRYVHHIVCPISDNTHAAGYTTVDHINRVKCDNRRKNLRPSRQSEQNANRDSRGDKLPPSQELLDIGILHLPRGVRWDQSENRFSGTDISILHELRAVTGLPCDPTGTKSDKCSTLEKFASCLVSVSAALVAHETHFPGQMEQKDVFTSQRIQLLDEYQQIAMLCHDQYPDVFDAFVTNSHTDGAIRMSFHEYVDFLLSKVCESLQISVQEASSLGGPREQAITLTAPSPGLILRQKSTAKGETVLTVLDAEYCAVWEMTNSKGMSLINWDVLDQRIHLFPEVCIAFPAIRTLFGSAKKISLGEFVYYVLRGNPVRRGHTIVPVNQQRNDVRAVNLEELPGIGKNYKASAVMPPPDVDIGMRYLPRGVSISNDRKAYMFVVSTSDTKSKFGFTAANASSRFTSNVLPLLQASAGGVAEWARRNEMYQRVTGEYFAAVDSNTK